MTILDQIISAKSKEVEYRKSLFPIAFLEQSIYSQSPCVSMISYLARKDKNGIIAEVKRKSPSKGIINPHINVEELSIGYMQAGASALSVLTDEKFFGGTKQDLITARKFNYCPILRKDFVIDDYQVFEARSWGADVILLIASALYPDQCRHLAETAKSLGMEVLLEVHNTYEIKGHINEYIDLVGVNNRNLKTFETAIENSIELASYLPKDRVLIAESGITSAADIIELKKYGYQGFLIGEAFMKNSHPQEACRKLVNELDKNKLYNYAEA